MVNKDMHLECDRSLMTNLFQPIVARRVFPCWDEPGIKTPFNISIVHPNGYTVLSNMGEATYEPESNNLNCTNFHVTPLISPSEVAIVMFDNTIRRTVAYNFGYMENGRNIWNLPHKNDALEFARTMIQEIKISMSRYTSRGSVTSKTDFIMIPHSPAKVTGTFGLVICRYTTRVIKRLYLQSFKRIKISSVYNSMNTFMYYM